MIFWNYTNHSFLRLSLRHESGQFKQYKLTLLSDAGVYFYNQTIPSFPNIQLPPTVPHLHTCPVTVWAQNKFLLIFFLLCKRGIRSLSNCIKNGRSNENIRLENYGQEIICNVSQPFNLFVERCLDAQEEGRQKKCWLWPRSSKFS